MSVKEKIAKVIRVISVPPVMVAVMLCVLALSGKNYFNGRGDVVVLIVLLGVLPVLAYPMQKIIPALAEQGRGGQRKLAFIMNGIGYTAAYIWSLLADTTWSVRLITSTYFLSVILLTICNKALHVRASGHACSFTGPIVLLIYLLDWKAVIPCLIAAVLIIWSSLALKRHTPGELAAGITVCILSFAISVLVL